MYKNATCLIILKSRSEFLSEAISFSRKCYTIKWSFYIVKKTFRCSQYVTNQRIKHITPFNFFIRYNLDLPNFLKMKICRKKYTQSLEKFLFKAFFFSRFPVTDDLLEQHLQGLKLSQAIAQKRLFMCDLHILEGLPVKEITQVSSCIHFFILNYNKCLYWYFRCLFFFDSSVPQSHSFLLMKAKNLNPWRYSLIRDLVLTTQYVVFC